MGAGLQCETLRNTSQTWIHRWWEYLFHAHSAVFMSAALTTICSLVSRWPLLGARYQALLIPHCPGALNDLAHSGSLHRILAHFISQQSELGACFNICMYFSCCFFRNTCTCGLLGFFPLCAEPVCAVGQGVSALCCATEGQRWIFSGYSLTGVSVWWTH